MSSIKFAAFDIDGTLVRWQFFHAIVHELGKRKLLDAATHETIRQSRMQWKTRQHPEAFREYESVLVHGYFSALQHISEEDHDAAIEYVFQQYRNQLFTYTRDLLKQLQDDGYLIFAISGSHEVVLAKLAFHLGIDDYVGATFDFQKGEFQSSPVHDKASALRALISKHGADFTGSVAVGDSESDIAMLEIVEKPIAFNPSRGLFDRAQRRGWPVIIERKNMVYTLENKDGSYVLA
jgi:HAD superfamily hydrolase (TIGR01490 family)